MKIKYLIIALIILRFAVDCFGQNISNTDNYNSNQEVYLYNTQKHPTLRYDYKLITDSLCNSYLSSVEYDKKGFRVNPLILSQANIGSNTGFLLAGGVSISYIYKKLDISYTPVFYNIDSSFYNPVMTFEKSIISGLGQYQTSGKYRQVLNQNYYIGFKPVKGLILKAGKGKHFIGEGTRSLFLSGNSSSFPYFEINAEYHRFKYKVLYALFKDIRPVYADKISGGHDKYSVMHYLSWNITSWLNIGFFESIVFHNIDSLNTRGFDYNYLNPVIFFRPVEFSLGSPDNSLLGASISIKPHANHVFFSNILIDDIHIDGIKEDLKHLIMPWRDDINYGSWMNKQAFQFGYKHLNAFKIKNLILASELNIVRPFTYSHKHIPLNYANSNQALAHPYGGNFVEWITKADYSNKNIRLKLFYEVAKIGLDNAGEHNGSNIYQSTFDAPVAGLDVIVLKPYKHEITQGVKSKIKIFNIEFNYFLNKNLNYYLSVGYQYRKQFEKVQYIYLGINLGINNLIEKY